MDRCAVYEYISAYGRREVRYGIIQFALHNFGPVYWDNYYIGELHTIELKKDPRSVIAIEIHCGEGVEEAVNSLLSNTLPPNVRAHSG